MNAMAIKRHTLHLDVQDMKRLARIAREETRAPGSRVTAAGIVRRIINEYLGAQDTKNSR